jgi:hypothetical protein
MRIVRDLYLQHELVFVTLNLYFFLLLMNSRALDFFFKKVSLPARRDLASTESETASVHERVYGVMMTIGIEMDVYSALAGATFSWSAPRLLALKPYVR